MVVCLLKKTMVLDSRPEREMRLIDFWIRWKVTARMIRCMPRIVTG